MRFLLVAVAVVAVLSFVPSSAHSESPNAADGWKAGVAKVRITPDKALWMTGFRARNGPSRGTLTDLYVKALALEDSSGRRCVIVTSDLLGFPSVVAENICREVEQKHGLGRDRILLNSSHTHGAPSLASPVQFIYGPRVSAEQRRDIEHYTRELEANVVGVIGSALKDLAPVTLSFGQGEAAFGVNRRKITPRGVQGFTPNPDGPVDRAVPVLRVDRAGDATDPAGARRMIAVVFGYAAHPTTITGGESYYAYSGDYATFAQQALEAEHDGAVALFVQGCGGDVMVFPRGTAELAKQYGQDLAKAVNATLAAPMRPLNGPVASAFDRVSIEFAKPLPTRERLATRAKDPDVYQSWHAKELLQTLDRDGALPERYAYPIQAWQFGGDLTLVALAGEVVADYSLQLKRSHGGQSPMWVAGYSNDLCAYIPTRRVLAEGGYEAVDSMTYYMHPNPWAPSIEDTILGKARAMIEQVRRK
jgi:hypothetical protein